MINKVIISIGSNINPHFHIKKGLSLIGEIINIQVISPLIETEPIGILNQPKFINGALLATTHLNQYELTLQLKVIEDIVGRDRTRAKFGAREIDFDIVSWNDCIVDQDYYERPFLHDLVDWVNKTQFRR